MGELGLFVPQLLSLVMESVAESLMVVPAGIVPGQVLHAPVLEFKH